MDCANHHLVSFGCSFTYGHGLPDCIDPNNKIGPGTEPSKVAWPNHLKTFLKFKSIDNKAIPGAGNKMIADRVVNYKFKENSVAIILWSNFERKTIFKDRKHDHWGSFSDHKLHMMPSFIRKDHMPTDFWDGFKDKDKHDIINLISTYYEDFHFDYDCVYENSVLINYIHSFLLSKGVKSIHLIMEHSIKEYKDVFNKLKIDTLQARTFNFLNDFHIDDGLDKQRKTRPHPGVKSQVYFAKNIIKWFFK